MEGGSTRKGVLEPLAGGGVSSLVPLGAAACPGPAWAPTSPAFADLRPQPATLRGLLRSSAVPGVIPGP